MGQRLLVRTRGFQPRVFDWREQEKQFDHNPAHGRVHAKMRERQKLLIFTGF
jgi:hypothetical protein